MMQSTFQPVIVAPTFNNAATLKNVLAKIAQLNLPVIAVNDGSTDLTANILQTWRDASNTERFLLTHELNRGKAAAIQTAFEFAQSRGFTHAITIDTDGQLDPLEIPRFLASASRRPRALVIGTRSASAADYPLRSRIGRWISNTMLELESGARVADSQCGLRVYPLQVTKSLHCRWGRYNFETEILARAAWAGVRLCQVPVSCVYDLPQGRVSHFQPWRDSFRGVIMHIGLLGRSIHPRRGPHLGDAATGKLWQRLLKWLNPARGWRDAKSDPAARTRLAAALATGVLIGNLPAYGFQSLLSLLSARWFGLHPLWVLAGSHISTPPLGPLLNIAAIAIGYRLLHGNVPSLVSFNPRLIGTLPLLKNLLLEWTLGAIICGTVLAMITFAISWLLMQWQAHRPADSTVHRAAPAPAHDPEAA